MRQLVLNPIKSWQQLLVEGFSSPHQLLAYLQIPDSAVALSVAAHQQFKTRVPKGFADKMQRGNINDPLLQQVLPLAAEELHTPGYNNDPLGEIVANSVKGLLHKYHRRVLLILSSACPINCRYCFRRHFPYKENNPGSTGWDEAFTYISNHPEINEVIFSGGEPLLLNDAALSDIIEGIKRSPHIKTLRIHTRMPIVLPERITPHLISLLANCGLHCVMVTHCNHTQELDDLIQHKMHLLRQAGIHLLNQSVLLQGINANSDSLCQLSHRLFECGIMPYYLHLLDKVQGTAHYAVELAQAQAIYAQMSEQLPGYLLPRLVREVAGAKHKVPVG